MTFKSFALAALCLPVVALAEPAADSQEKLTVEPGRYQIVMTTTNPLTGLESTDVEQECVKEPREFTPTDIIDNVENCQMLEENSTAQTMQFVMNCDMGGGKGRFAGQYQVSGRVGTGEVTLQLSLGDHAMNLKMDWETRRLGDC